MSVGGLHHRGSLKREFTVCIKTIVHSGDRVLHNDNGAYESGGLARGGAMTWHCHAEGQRVDSRPLSTFSDGHFRTGGVPKRMYRCMYETPMISDRPRKLCFIKQKKPPNRA
jgi:hypothetical protein